ncbi:MAG: homocysteine methyltransferase [Firmicutes bacterium]|nr:homocysteine methyltransferase [Bacillota bacterium]
MKLSEFLAGDRKPILLDGAMGTQLAAAGVEMGGQTNLTHPEAVLAVHRQYVEAGAELLITNTLTMNRVYIETHHPGLDLREVNLAGARLAREAAGEGCYVLGDISSTGQMLEPYGDLSEEDAFKAFYEQATVLAEGGVDGFIIETMFSLAEALCALRACRAAAGLPVIVSMAFSTVADGGRTIMGDSAQDCALNLMGAGATAVGANCGDLDPFQTAEIVVRMQEAGSTLIIAQPNAGKPKLVEGRTVFEMTAYDFAAGIYQCYQAGARLLGGCCGTTPEHIRAAAGLLKKEKKEA